MAGIAGILKKGKKSEVDQMLNCIIHRGSFDSRIFEFEDATIGIVWSENENIAIIENAKQLVFTDGPGYGQKAGISRINNHWQFHRDELGVSPLYLAYEGDEVIFFASEIKALLPFSNHIVEMNPAHILSSGGLEKTYSIRSGKKMNVPEGTIADDLRALLSKSIQRRIHSEEMGAWLSGGLDSSTIAALARPHVRTLHTFAGGLKGSPDLKYAQDVASYIGSHHHEAIITLENMLRILPEVIYQLESFDALLVRSSIINLSVAWAASEYVSEIFSGEGGDELFAGYSYLKEIPQALLEDELLNITESMHNTALQRVDRCSSAFGTTAHVIFADPEVVEFAFRIPIEYKIKEDVEKWILRQSMLNLLPESVIYRPKAKFWEGSGVGSLIWEHAYKSITDHDFLSERKLINGWSLNTKEELLYYRIFKERFGEIEILDWMGRSKGSPVFDNLGKKQI